jgi:hypothetical protein
MPVRMIPVWRLQDGLGDQVQCVVRRMGLAWLLLVQRGGEDCVAEHHRLSSQALARATEIHGVFTELGYSEQVH